MSEGVRVEAPARLHLGLIDLRGELGRRFGGLGAALERPSVTVEVRPAREVKARGPGARRAEEFARRFLQHHGLERGAAIHVRRAIQPHVGLGSGTQLALSVSAALAELFGMDTDADELARTVGRGRRSAVGTWLFQRGGFVVEGGRSPDRPPPGPLLFHHKVPERWRCVVAIPDVPRGLSGKAEAAAFKSLPPPSTQKVGRIARLVLMCALPALLEEDLKGFGEAVSEIQEHVGDCFKEAQGGRFAHPTSERLIRELRSHGACGAGQTSWGPAVFALAADADQAEYLAGLARENLDSGGEVFVTPFANVGARSHALPAG